MLSESGSGTLAGGAHTETFLQIARGDAVSLSEVFQREIDLPLTEGQRPFPARPPLFVFPCGNKVNHLVRRPPASFFAIRGAIRQSKRYLLSPRQTGLLPFCYLLTPPKGSTDKRQQEQTTARRQSGQSSRTPCKHWSECLFKPTEKGLGRW